MTTIINTKKIVESFTNIFIYKKDLNSLALEAKEKTNNVYAFYSLRDKMYNDHLQKVSGRKNIFFVSNGEDVADSSVVNTKEIVTSKDGFTSKEYTEMTNTCLPSLGGQIREYNGKVHYFEEAGNMSPNTFSSKGELIVEIVKLTDIKVNII